MASDTKMKSSLNIVKVVIKGLIISNPHKMTICELMEDYKRSEGCPLPYANYGFHSVEEFLRSMPDFVELNGHGFTAVVRPVQNAKSKHIQELVRQQKHDKPKRFPKEQINASNTKNTKNRFVQNKNQGMSSNDKQPNRQSSYDQNTYSTYNQKSTKNNKRNHKQNNRKFGNNMTNTNELHIGSESSKSASCSNSGHANYSSINIHTKQIATYGPPREFNNNRRICFNRSHTKNPVKFDEPDYDNMESSDDSPENLLNTLNLNLNVPEVFKSEPEVLTRPDDFDDAVPDFAATSQVFAIDFPNNTMKFGDRIPPYKIPEHFDVGSVLTLYVSEVHSPYKFWFQIANEDDEISSLMKSLDRAYKDSEDNFIIPVKCIMPGLVCAAKYEGEWHRAEIVGYVKDKLVKCYYVDFGTVADARISEIKFLYKKFGTLAKQAIRGSLAGIQPLHSTRFSKAATMHFLSRVRGEKLHAQIREIEETNRVFHLVLCKTSGPNVIQLNKDLMEHHYARLDANWSAAKRLKNQRKRHPREDYPTFDALESGEYPSLNELARMLDLGVDYERFFDNYLSKLGSYDTGVDNPISSAKPFGLPLGLLKTNPFAKDIP